MLRRLAAGGIAVSCALLLWGDQARGDFRRVGAEGHGNGPNVNLIVREIAVSPIRARVGERIRADMVVENRGDLWNDTIRIELLANGVPVASELFRFGFGGEGERIYRKTLHWDTKGARPGEYRIRGEVFLSYDASPFDNFLDVDRPVLLLPPGAAFPGGEKEGGAAVTRDPRYKPAVRPPQEGGGTGAGAGDFR
jgi:hypothetical protein